MSDENKNIENNEDNQNENLSKKNNNSQIGKFIIVVLVIFLAVFAAVYTVVDMNMHRLGLQPFVVSFKQIEKIFDDEQFFDQDSPVKIEEKDNKYIVTVNLNLFDNNPDNIDVSVEQNGIRIKGDFQKSVNGEMKQSSIFQNVIFHQKINEKNIQKSVKKNRMIIVLPFEN